LTSKVSRYLSTLCLWYPYCLQCFDAVGWAAGRASGFYKLRGCLLAGYVSGARCRLAYGPADATATVSRFSKIQIGFTLLVPAYPGSPGKRAVKRVCVFVVPTAGFKLIIKFKTAFHLSVIMLNSAECSRLERDICVRPQVKTCQKKSMSIMSSCGTSNYYLRFVYMHCNVEIL